MLQSIHTNTSLLCGIIKIKIQQRLDCLRHITSINNTCCLAARGAIILISCFIIAQCTIHTIDITIYIIIYIY